ncbi:hypothetical protein M5K25_010790 [Dendrobium thyrsiflorum]|uniref:DUF8040 domain-containing protein n=1 Tax=Dendrobium thyrsiflorum TaxID=117978 RepID=A0ABD0V1I6_DENTH
MTSSYRGDKWIGELLQGHPTQFHNMFRMSQAIFVDLLHDLECAHGLHGSSRTTSREEARDGEGAEEMIQLREQITDALMDEMN